MNIIQAIETCTKKSFVWRGRASRSEFWYFYLFHVFFISGSFMILAALMMAKSPLAKFSLILILFSFLYLIPLTSVSVRRLHDTGRSAAWMLLNFIPFATIVLIFFWAQRGDQGSNKYGDNPIGDHDAEVF